MQLTYRGHAYEVPDPIQSSSDSTDQPKIKLIYRGHTHHVTLRHLELSEAIELGEETVMLMYRGSIYKRRLQSSKTHQQPRVITWRYQLGEG